MTIPSSALERVSRKLAACALLAIVSRGAAADVWVVTDRAHPVTVPPAIRVILLDEPAHIEAEFARALPADPDRAATIARQRLEDSGGKLYQHLAGAYQGVTDAWSLGITKIPAVIVDRRYVVYGETDVKRALAKIERYRTATP